MVPFVTKRTGSTTMSRLLLPACSLSMTIVCADIFVWAEPQSSVEFVLDAKTDRYEPLFLRYPVQTNVLVSDTSVPSQ